jgi:hypothetical protein
MAIDYQELIPNNVDLAGNKVLQRALEHWQPRFLDWFREMGPSDFHASDVYLRTATSVDAGLPLGHLSRRRRARPPHRLRRRAGQAGLAADSR